MTPRKKRKRAKNFQSAFIVAYDLPSENIKALGTQVRRDSVNSVRSYSSQLFHSLGAQTTESVILVSPARESNIKPIIETVKRMYQSLHDEFFSKGLDLDLVPIIEVIGLSTKQRKQYEALAIRYIENKAVACAKYLTRVEHKLEKSRSQKQILRLIFNLEKYRKTWEEIQRLTSELALSNDWHIPRILADIDKLLNQLHTHVSE